MNQRMNTGLGGTEPGCVTLDRSLMPVGWVVVSLRKVAGRPSSPAHTGALVLAEAWSRDNEALAHCTPVRPLPVADSLKQPLSC